MAVLKQIVSALCPRVVTWLVSCVTPILHRILALHIMINLVVLSLSLGLLTLLGWWGEPTVSVLPLTPSPFNDSRVVTPDYCPRSHPGRSFHSTDNVPCRHCGVSTVQQGVRHLAWWSGDETRVGWMQGVYQCNVCNTLNLVQEVRIDNELVGQPHTAILGSPGRWRSIDNLYGDTMSALEPPPCQGKTPLLNTPALACGHHGDSSEMLPHGQYNTSRDVWTFVGVVKREKEAFQIVRCRLCGHGSVITTRASELRLFGFALSWPFVALGGLLLQWMWWVFAALLLLWALPIVSEIRRAWHLLPKAPSARQ